MPYRVPATLDLSVEERGELESWARRRKTAQGLALRARIVLLAADGLSNTAISAELATGKHTVGKWRERFAHQRADGLLDEPRPGAPRRIGDEQISADTFGAGDITCVQARMRLLNRGRGCRSSHENEVRGNLIDVRVFRSKRWSRDRGK